MDKVADGSVDMILCDLPYGTTACKWDTIIPFEPLWKQYKRIIKRNGAIVLTASQPFTSALVMSNPKWFRYEWIWEKHQGVNPMVAAIQPLKKHEQVLVFYAASPTYNPQMRNGQPYRGFLSKNGAEIGEAYVARVSRHRDNPSGERYPTSIIAVKSERTTHPTQKPVALMEYLILTYTNEGETVLDNCFGSGTTGVACVNLNRSFIGIEKDAEYFNVGKARIEQAERDKSELLIA